MIQSTSGAPCEPQPAKHEHLKGFRNRRLYFGYRLFRAQVADELVKAFEAGNVTPMTEFKVATAKSMNVQFDGIAERQR